MRISAHVSPELQALLTRVRELPTDVRKQIRRVTKTEALPIWQESVAAHVQTRLEARVLGQTARVAVTDNAVRLQAARVGKTLAGGLSIKTQWHAVEFGGDQGLRRQVESTGPKGARYRSTRRTQRQLRPRRRTGYVVFPAVADAIPRIAALWLQTVARAGHEAMRG